MADDFVDAGLCSGSWWSAARADASGMPASASCSSAITDTGGGSTGVAFSWLPTAAEVEPASSSFGLLPNPSLNWNQPLLTSFHGMIQEPLDYGHQIHMSPQEINQQQLLLGPQQPGFPVMLQGPFEPEPTLMAGSYQAAGSNDSFANFTQLLNSSTQSSTSTIANHLLFPNNSPFWNPSATEAKSGAYPSSAPVQFVNQSLEYKPNYSSIATKSYTDSAAKRSSSSSSSEASLKKQRIETPLPLPALKVRKEKLGDRITALQQLVSPFGKTDTASVLHEAIDYIKFLHDQVNMLSTPYLKNGNPMQHQQANSEISKDGEGKKDLRSRGLCLVPMESIYPVAGETMADFWTPTFGGTYR